MSRCPSLALALLCAAVPTGAADLDVSGKVTATAPRLRVELELTNRAAGPVEAIDVQGELLGEAQQARLAGPLAPGASGAVSLEFAASVPRPGVYALALLVEHPLPGTPDAAGNPPLASEPAYVLLALGARPAPAVRMQADPLRLEVRGELVVHLASTDGVASHVRLRALAARGLRVEGAPQDVALPPSGEARARLAIVRAGAPRGSRLDVLLIAETPDAPVARTSVAGASVEVRPEAALLPRVRWAALALGLALVALAVGYELLGRGASRASDLA